MLFNLLSQFHEVLRSLWPQSAARLNDEGARLRERGRLDEAIAVLNRAIGLDSRMAEAYAHRCACYCDLDEYTRAMEDGNQAVALAPEMATAFRARAYAAYCLGQNESAISDMNEALRLDPEDPWMYYERGRARCAAGDFRAALADAERFLEKCPDEAIGYDALARVRHNMGDLDAALAAIEEAVKLEPKNGELLVYRARFLCKLSRLEEALAGFEAALAQPCEAKGEWRAVASVGLNWVNGRIAMKQGNYREAIEQFGAALEIIEQSADLQESIQRLAHVYHDRGLAWHSLGEYENALRDLDEAVRLKPEDEDSLYFRAHLLLLCNRIEEASATYEAALENDPEAKEGRNEETIAHRNWLAGAIALKQGDLREAIELFDAALGAIEQSEGVLKRDQSVARVYNDRGEAWYLLREYEHALRDFGQAVTLHPDHPVHYINRAQALIWLRRYEEADQDFAEAVQRGADCAHSHACFAWSMATCRDAELRDGKQAVIMAHKAMELAGRHPSSRYWAILAAAYAEDGNFDEAVRWQTKRLAAAPDDVSEEQRLECERVLKRYQAGIPYRTSESEDSES